MQQIQKYIPHTLIVLGLIVGAFLIKDIFANNPTDKENPFLQEASALEEKVQKLEKEREEKRVQQLEVYEKWKQEDATLSEQIVADKKKLEGLKIYLGTAHSTPESADPGYSYSLIPKAHAGSNTNNNNDRDDSDRIHKNGKNVSKSAQGLQRNSGGSNKNNANSKKVAPAKRETGTRKQETQIRKPDNENKKYWQAYNFAIPLIKKYEGLYLKAYWDYNPHHCSIGYGSIARSCSEAITKEEADRRLSVVVKKLVTRVQKDFPTLTAKQQSALVSLAFNCETGYRIVKRRGLQAHKGICRSAGGKVLRGLVNRRNEEAKYLFSK